MSIWILAVIIVAVIFLVWFMNTQLNVPPGLKTGGNIAVFVVILLIVLALILRVLGIPVSTRI